MAVRGKAAVATDTKNGKVGSTPRSLAIAEAGIKNSLDFRNLMSAVMSDVVAGRLSTNATNAACNAGGKLLKMVELEHKYGSRAKQPAPLTMAFENPALSA